MIGLLVALLALLPSSLAINIPHPHINIPNIIPGHGSHHDEPPHFCPVIDKQEEIPGTAWQVGVSVPGGGSIQVQEQHEVGTTWEQGEELSIGISYIVSAAAAISISVAETVTDSIAETGSLTCPAGLWHCSLMIYPSMIRLRGHVKKLGPNDKCDGGEFSSDTVQDGATWVLVLPRKDASGNGFWGVEVCTCVNLKHAKDEGHPKVDCSEDCAQTGAP